MLLIGLAFLVVWLIAFVFTVELLKAILIVAIIFIILGLLLEHGDSIKKHL